MDASSTGLPGAAGAVDAWSIGSLDKVGIWSYYVAVNYLGVLLNAIQLFSVVRLPLSPS
jgi:hypothetical protein